MRYMGIDFGSKRVGIALSDGGCRVAFPHSVLKNTPSLVAEVKKLSVENGIAGIVMGESRDLKGGFNPIMKDILAFKEDLERELGVEVSLEPEFFTSAAANRQMRPNKPDGRIRSGRTMQKQGSLLDASAAALILQSYLDRQNHESNANSDANNHE